MYSVFVDGVCIYDDVGIVEEYAIINPVLTMEDNAAGSFEFTIPPTNAGYGLVKRMTSEVVVMRGGSELWSGRPITDDYDIFKNQKVVCEGELAYLNDTIQPPAEYHTAASGTSTAVRKFLSDLIDVHNSQLEENSNKVFAVGAVTVTDPNDYIYRYTNFENTLEAISEKLVSRLGGHIRIRKLDGVRYIDYLADPVVTNTQVITFGENLLDYAESFNMDDVCTVIVPRGARLEEEDIPPDYPSALDPYLTVASVNHGSIYVVNQAAVNRYGWIVKVVDWNDVENPNVLYAKAVDYLNAMWNDEETSLFNRIEFKISAFDKSLVDNTQQPINVLDKIRVISEPHQLDRYFTVTKLQIPLQNPENATFNLGDVSAQALSSVEGSRNNSIRYEIERILSGVTLPTQEILDQAFANSQAIMNQFMNGYISWVQNDVEVEGRIVHQNELYITDTEDYNAATKLWRWNLGGLAYAEKEADDPISSANFVTAITMDGAILGEFIAANSISGNKIYGGIIQDVYANPAAGTGNYWDLTNGILHVSGISNAEVNTTYEYCIGSSDTTAPPAADPGWSEDYPTTRPSGTFIWQRINTTFADGTHSYTSAMCVANGRDGLVPYIITDKGTDVSNLEAVSVTLTGIIGNGDGEDSDPYGNDYLYIWFVRKDNNLGYSYLDVGKRITISIDGDLCNEFAGIWFTTDVGDTYYKNEGDLYYTNESGSIYAVCDLPAGATGST